MTQTWEKNLRLTLTCTSQGWPLPLSAPHFPHPSAAGVGRTAVWGLAR